MLDYYRKLKSGYYLGETIRRDSYHIQGNALTDKENLKNPSRSDIINYLLNSLGRDTVYLEIGVRFPWDNFDKILATTKYSVDPGFEFKENPVDFKLTSDDFFDQLKKGQVLNPDIKFDVIFIDGLHYADQAYADIANSLNFLKEDGYIIMHDCNPPTEFHARDAFKYNHSPAGICWNGTTWKSFYRARLEYPITAVCIDTDWGVGVISPKQIFGKASQVKNPFYEFHVFDKYRTESLNLISFDQLKSIIVSQSKV